MDRGYARISLDTKVSGSISKQKARITAHIGGTEPEWYTDESVSGSKVPFAERPDGGRLLRDLRAGDRVLVTRIDRAARNVRDLLSLVEHIEQVGASIVFLDNKIDTGGATGKFFLTVLAALAEFEAGLIAERRRESLEQFKNEGRHAVGAAPIGFMSVPNPSGRGLVIAKDPETAPAVREAVLRVMGGESQNKVRESLALSKTGFARLLRNPRLCGMTPDGDGVVMVDGMPRINPEAAILTMDEWLRLQSKLGTGDKSWTRRGGYGAAMVCGTCAQRLYYQLARNPDDSTYRCRRDLMPEAQHPAINARNADAHIEREFLNVWGSHRVPIIEVVDDSADRIEAIAVAKVALKAASAAFEVAESEEAEADALAAQRIAKKALRDAEARTANVRTSVMASDRTIADAWADGSDAHRVRMILLNGSFSLALGRGAVEQRLTFNERQVTIPAEVYKNLRPFTRDELEELGLTVHAEFSP